MKIGIISFAHMHAFGYAQAIQKQNGVELVGIFDEDEARGKKMAQQFEMSYYSDYEKLLEDVSAVVVTSENVKHREHVIAAANANVHVLCEKPLATKKEDAKEMIAVCKEKGVMLQTAFPVRFNSSVERAKQMIDNGQLGRILAIKGTNRGTNPGGWFLDVSQSGGGAVIDHTVHVVDLMRWFMKAEVREVFAEVDNRFLDETIDDCGILTFEFDNGVFATLDCSWSRNKTYPTWGDVTLEIVGTEGTLSIDAFAQKLNVYDNKDGVKWDFYGDDMDEGLIKDFIDAVRTKREPSITGIDGLRAIEVAFAAYESSKTNKSVSV
jgi:predicted dehydrogenase